MQEGQLLQCLGGSLLCLLDPEISCSGWGRALWGPRLLGGMREHCGLNWQVTLMRHAHQYWLPMLSALQYWLLQSFCSGVSALSVELPVM